MRKDISIEKVTDVALAITTELVEGNEEWYVYLLNLQSKNLEGLIINSKGYGKKEGKEIKTTTLRQFFEKVEAHSFVKIELIDKQVFSINNEFWISYWQDQKMFDKKFVFVAESIAIDYFTEIPILNKKGVMIR